MGEDIRILILEDVPVDAELAIREIKKSIANGTFKTVDNKQDYLEALKNFAPQLIISDYTLPGFDGLSALKLSQEISPPTPFIIFTGSQNEDIAVECMKAGAKDYVIKEHLKRLGTAVISALETRKSELEQERVKNEALDKQKEYEQKLIESEARAQAFLTSNPDLMFMFSEDGRVLDCVSEDRSLLIRDPEDIIGKSINELVDKHLADLALDAIKAVKATNSAVTYEYELQLGKSQYFESRFVKCGEGKYLNIVRDITQGKLAEIRLQSSESRYKALLEANPDLMFLLTEDGKFLEFKAVNSTMLYAQPGQFLGKHLHDVMPKYVADLTMEGIKLAKQAGTIQTYFYELMIDKLEYFECRMVPCGKSEFLAIVRDITERRQFEKQLQKSEEKYRRIFETSNEGIICIDAECRVTMVNQKTSDMLGYTIDEIKGKFIEDFLFEDDLSDHERRVQERATGKVGSYERRYKRKDGSTLWTIISATPEIDEQGNYVGSFGMLTDITDRKLFEEKLKDSEERFRSLFETANEGIVGINSDRKVIFANQKMADMLGFTIAEMIDSEVSRFLYPEDMPDYHKNTEERLNGIQGHYDRKLRKKDGSAIWFNVSATPVVKKDGVGIEAYAMYTDITDRKHNEQLLQDALIRYKAQRDNMQSVSLSPSISAGDVDALAKEICEKTAIGMHIDRVSVWIFDENKTRLTCLIQYDKNTKEFTSGMVLLESAFSNEFGYLETSNYVDCDFALSDPRAAGYVEPYLKPNNIVSMLDAVIKSQGKNLGVICMEIVDTPHHWEQDEITHACQLADQISLTIENQKRIYAEHELQNSEDRYKSILEAAPVGIAIHTDGKIVYANPAGAQIMAAKETGEILGRDIKDIIHPDLLEDTINRIKRFVAGEKGLYPNEEIFIRLDGTTVPVEVISSMIEYQNKPSFQVIVTDITERKKAEMIAKRNEQRLKSIINILQYKTDSIQELVDFALAEAIKLTESADGFLFFYEEDLDSYRYSLLGAANLNMISPKGVNKETNISPSGFWSDVIKKREPVIINDYQASEKMKSKLPQGHVPLQKVLSLPIIVGNKIVVVAGVVNKKTDYDAMDVLQLTLLLDSLWKVMDVKQNENELRKLTRAVEQSPVSILITDIDGNIEYVNDFFTSITGYSSEEVVGKNPRIFKSGYTSDDVYQNLWDTILSGKTWTGELCNQKKNGEHFWENASISPVINPEGKVINFIAVKEDVTERKRITEELILAKEEAEQMSKIKSSFLANMSHELRTPMVGILGYSELLDNMVQEAEVKEMANTINVSGKRLLHTLNQILDLSRVEANLQEIQWEIIELNSFLRDKVKLFEIVAMKKGLELSFKSIRNEILLKTDSRLLEHVINDLINNAIKYTDKGNVIVYLTIEKAESGNNLQIKVTDTGIGIPLKQQEIVFDAFRQVSEGLNRSFEGTGLGLTISRKYIEILGGKIHLESKVGVGSTFTVSFPETKHPGKATKSTDDKSKGKEVKEEISVSKTKVPHVLLIDDDEISFILIQRMLKGLVELDYADNGQKGLDLINKTAYSMVLLDINLPRGIGGLEVLSRIKNMDAYKKVPIVAVTAYSMVGDKETFLAKGCSYYLSKPFTKDELVGLLSFIR